MSYVLTDDDFNKLFIVKNQLGFMSALLSTARNVQCHTEEIDSMLVALKAPIEQVMDSLEAREEIGRLSEGMRNHDWSRLIALVSGRDSMSVRDIVKMDDKLARCVTVDPGMDAVFSAWRVVMTDDGRKPMMKNHNDMGGFHVKFELPKHPELPPVTEQSIVEMYGVKTARDVIKKMVAMGNGQDDQGTPSAPVKKVTQRRTKAAVAA